MTIVEHFKLLIGKYFIVGGEGVTAVWMVQLHRNIVEH